MADSDTDKIETTRRLLNGDCLEYMKKLPDKSIDLFICDLPYGETNCKWDCKIDMVEFWKEFKRIRKSTRTACIHFCSTKFGYTLIKSWEKGFKMDMVWKKRNKTGGLQSRNRPMRNHEMVYFFYEQAPKYNRDKYHKRIVAVPDKKKEKKEKKDVVEDKDEFGWDKSVVKEKGNKIGKVGANFEPPNPVSVVETINEDTYEDGERTHSNKACKGNVRKMKDLDGGFQPGPKWDPKLPPSVLEEFIEPAEDEPVSMFESTKVFIGKRHHQTEKPQDILEFFLKYWTDEGDTVLDPTMGSGSTGVACEKLNRNFIGYELDPTIFKVAQKRMNQNLPQNP